MVLIVKLYAVKMQYHVLHLQGGTSVMMWFSAEMGIRVYAYAFSFFVNVYAFYFILWQSLF